MIMLVLSALVLLLATAPSHAADPPKVPTATQSQSPGPAIQSDAVKPLTQPNVVTPPAAKPVPPPTPGGGPAVSGPKAGPGAPAAGPTVPTIPAGGVPGIDPSLRDANQLDAIRDLKQLDQLNRDPLQRGRPAGTGDDGPFNPQTLGRGIEQSPGHQGPDGYFRDCFPNPQDCISGGARDRSAPGNAGDRLGAPPTAAGGVPDPRGVAADGSWRERGLRQTWDGTRSARAVHEDTHGNTTSIRIERTPLETRNQPTTAQDETHRTTIVIVVSRGDRDVAESRQVITHNSKGDVVENLVSEEGNRPPPPAEVRAWYRHAQEWVTGARDDPPPTQTGPVRASGGGPDSQPSEAPTGGAGNDGCNWAPIHGCLNPREDIRTTIRQQTTQPGINPDGQGTEGGTGSSRGGSTGPEAVTNTGDGSFGVQRSGNSGHGTPIWQTMPDPARGGPGGPAPGSPAGRAGSDAGLDASLGAVPPPR